MFKFLIIFLIFFSFSLASPTNFIFRDDEESSLHQFDVLPSKNATQIFMFHPNATRKAENGEFFQGDMVLTEAQQRFYEGDDVEDENEVDGIFTRTGVLNTRYRWPKESGKVIVPFKINNDAKFCEFEIKINFYLKIPGNLF